MVFNEELVQIAALTSGGVCFSLGGMRGGRFVRRYALPLALSGCAWLLTGFWSWRLVAFALALSFALHLGYGERTPYWRKFLVFCLYAASTLFFGFTIWQIITPVIMMLLFIASNAMKFATEFRWKVVEFIWGVLIAATLIGAIK